VRDSIFATPSHADEYDKALLDTEIHDETALLQKVWVVEQPESRPKRVR
jgi:hypothetical protein